jgi:hypothetical protein
MPQRESSHKKAQEAQKELSKNVFVLFVPFCGYSFCGALWQTLLNFSLVPVVIRSEQGFGRL